MRLSHSVRHFLSFIIICWSIFSLLVQRQRHHFALQESVKVWSLATFKHSPILPSSLPQLSIEDPIWNSTLREGHTPSKSFLQVWNASFSGDTLPDKIPLWMRDYFQWHSQVRAELNETNWRSQKYLVLRCIDTDHKCGGLADRLKPLPFFIRVAAQTQRLFMIRWEKPAKLEEFLLPNILNWSVPEWIETAIKNQTVDKCVRLLSRAMFDLSQNGSTVTVFETKVQDVDGGEGYYQRLVSDPNDTYENIYHYLFRALFQPSPPIAELATTMMKRKHLVPGEFAVAHYRAYYAIEDQKDLMTMKLLKKYALNAVACASQLKPGGPVYLASDSKDAIRVIEQYAKEWNRSIVSLDSDEALHVDKFSSWDAPPPSSFYSVFVDMLIMANGVCTAYGQGGFGRFASLISYNASCTHQHVIKGVQMHKCSWRKS